MRQVLLTATLSLLPFLFLWGHPGDTASPGIQAGTDLFNTTVSGHRVGSSGHNQGSQAETASIHKQQCLEKRQRRRCCPGLGIKILTGVALAAMLLLGILFFRNRNKNPV